NTEETETREEIFKVAFANTMQVLKKKLGDDVASWNWGDVHTLEHPHVLGAVSPMDKIFNVGPLKVPGGNMVINNLMFDLSNEAEFKVKGGPALRKLVDLGNISNAESILPTGQSGNKMSEHYDDQAEMYATGQFRKLQFSKEEIEKNERILLFKPEK
ncbi:MAG: penicillin acylase family protein, partial [Cyclobacteriaceae bacterium]|nr:penicillin acylase family protein [Cyclobacteriaceae bacterium]